MQQHVLRIGLTVAAWALLWHLALPAVSLSWWLYLATLRMLVSRLPLIPNKDLVFAGVAVFTLGHETDIASLMGAHGRADRRRAPAGRRRRPRSPTSCGPTAPAGRFSEADG